MRHPNLFIIGAMKSATTSLCRELGAHENVYMAPAKETFYFGNHYRTHSLLEYLQNFSGAANEQYVAEGTTDYADFPARDGVAKRLKIFSPNSRIIYMLREPFERAVSQYQHFVLSGREKRALSVALVSEPSYLWRSYYAAQLRNYLQYYDRNDIYVGLFEEYRADPLIFLNRLFDWLGVERWHQVQGENVHSNRGTRQKTLLDEGSARVKLVRLLKQSSLINRLAPDGAKTWYKNNIAPKKHVDFDSEEFQCEVSELRGRLAPMFAVWQNELTELWGIRPPW